MGCCCLKKEDTPPDSYQDGHPRRSSRGSESDEKDELVGPEPGWYTSLLEPGAVLPVVLRLSTGEQISIDSRYYLASVFAVSLTIYNKIPRSSLHARCFTHSIHHPASTYAGSILHIDHLLRAQNQLYCAASKAAID